MEDYPSNAILLEKIENLHEKVEEIKEQVLLTNGSVANLKIWKGYLTGGIAVLTALVIPVLFLLIEQWIRR